MAIEKPEVTLKKHKTHTAITYSDPNVTYNDSLVIYSGNIGGSGEIPEVNID